MIDENIKVIREGKIKNNEYILYWMQAAQRTEENPALDYAIQMANDIEVPLVVIFNLVSDFPDANYRHYYFMLEGLKEVKTNLEKENIKFIIKIGDPLVNVAKLAKNAVMLISDRGYLRLERKWREDIKDKIECRYLLVNTNTIVPVEIASDKEEYGAYTIRKKINSNIDRFLNICVNEKLKKSAYNINDKSIEFKNINSILNKLGIDDKINKVENFKGGTNQAEKLLDYFIENNLKDYELNGNNPDNDTGSKLSPYLHFGQISPSYIYKRIKSSGFKAENFLEQLVVRRELSFNYVYFNRNYDRSLNDILPNWAIETLEEHKEDKREYTYNLKQFENYNTHDNYWNSAQKEMVKSGYMNGYMRMYWGKKILEWSNNYQKAFDNIIYLNNKYFLDGRDPNSFAGIAWIFGKHDRAWKERKIYGKIRYMNKAGLDRKFAMEDYLNKVHNLD